MGAIRFTLALSVLFNHLNIPALLSGQVAVQSFFLVSGFLIAHVLTAKDEYSNKRLFYKNRILRIFPLYLLILLTTLLYRVVQVILNAPEQENFFTSDAPFGLKIVGGLLNIILLGQDLTLFFDTDSKGIFFEPVLSDAINPFYKVLLVPQSWSLSLELLFYLIVPYVIKNKKIVISLLCLSLLSRYICLELGLLLIDPWSYRFFINELTLFLLGLSVRLYVFPKVKNLIVGKTFVANTVTILLIIIIMFIQLIPIPNVIKSLLFLSVFAASMPFLILSRPTKHLFLKKIDQDLGKLSYPIYICHILVITLISTEFLGSLSTSRQKLFVVFVVLITSFTLERLICAPIENKRNHTNWKSND